jgi:hypothetical protein
MHMVTDHLKRGNRCSQTQATTQITTARAHDLVPAVRLQPSTRHTTASIAAESYVKTLRRYLADILQLILLADAMQQRLKQLRDLAAPGCCCRYAGPQTTDCGIRIGFTDYPGLSDEP